MTSAQRGILGEILALWLVTLLLIRGLVSLVQGAGAPQFLLALVPVLFMYTPVWSCRLRGDDPWKYPMALPAFGDREEWVEGVKLAGLVSAGILVPFAVGYHFWQTGVFGFRFLGILPDAPLRLVLYHLFFVAIPEEMFYRGYMQTRLDGVWAPRWRIWGASLGPGWIVTCFIFAIGHSVVQVQWWHLFIVFPSLVFGWMRARSGSVVPGAFFHAFCNIFVAFLDTAYGVIPPDL